MIPIQLRVGGAFIALALVLVIYAAVAFFRGEGVFEFTPRELAICLAALLFGANATFVRGQPRSRAQVLALAAAVVLVILGVLMPREAVFATQTYWLLLWAGGAVVCALILRQNAT
ncbi:hypothetical protein SAMN04488535_0550 [Corynebacterium mycetoides]|uniref:Uncharacterized protein n=1 Tax=Corynebacterium mycetoides TaxID=38302 RepID=A0A1G9MD65_9CORY|nr:hypothetical protein [Corynebacterium mycetoides]SDL72074.1 hypothetical protein SAMN04488535_0550 [Corynebacterium mycetoides]